MFQNKFKNILILIFSLLFIYDSQAQIIDNNEYILLNNIKSINFDKIKKEILSFEYYSYNNNKQELIFDKKNHKIIRYNYGIRGFRDGGFDFFDENNKLKFKLRCADCSLNIINDFYYMKEEEFYFDSFYNTVIYILNPKDYELKALSTNEAFFLGSDELGVYFKVSFANNEWKIIRIRGFEVEDLTKEFSFNIPVNNFYKGLMQANKDFAFIETDSLCQIEAKKLQFNLPKYSVFLYGNLFEIKDIPMVYHDKFELILRPPILYDSILYFNAFYSETESKLNYNKQQITSLNKDGIFKDIFKENRDFWSIQEFKIFNNYMFIALSAYTDEVLKFNGFPNSRIEVIDLKTMKRIDFKKVEIKLVKVNIK